MRTAFISIVGLAGACNAGPANESAANMNSGNAVSPAAQATCDMTPPGNRTLGPPGSADRTPERIRQVARWDEEMREKARRCAEQAGFTNVSRMIQRPAGTHVMDANREWTRTTEETWLGRGTRDGREVPVVVTAGGRVEIAPATQAS
jgi:hypothetical protein